MPPTKEVIPYAHQRSGGHRNFHLRRRLNLLEAEARRGGGPGHRVRAVVRREGGERDRHAAGIRPGQIPESGARRRVRDAAPAASFPAVQGPPSTRAYCPPLSKSRVTV